MPHELIEMMRHHKAKIHKVIVHPGWRMKNSPTALAKT